MAWIETGATVVGTSALTLLGMKLFGPSLFGRAGDDAPIVMTGGSFHIHSFGPARLKLDTTLKIHRLLHSLHCKVKDIEVNGTPVKGIDDKTNGSVVFSCLDASNTPRKITVKFENDGDRPLEISSEIPDDIDNFAPTKPGCFKHAGLRITDVAFLGFAGPPVPCNGRCCSVVFWITT